MTCRSALPLLAIVLTSCAAKPKPPQPIPAVAEQRQCPPYPRPPANLMKPPLKTRLPLADRLEATEQAIQLDELIKWVRAQAAVDSNGTQVRSQPRD
jgi:hypothetical protein